MSDSLNPFSSRFVKPGAISFLPSQEHELEEFVRNLENARWFGEIVGPHGCGKSTFLASVIPLIPKECMRCTIHSDQDPREQYQSLANQLEALTKNHLLVIDGFEQFLESRRQKILQLAHNQNVGLLVTCHQTVGLPTLLVLKPDLNRFRQVVHQLVGDRSIRPTEAEIERAYSKYEPNLREALFALYDVYELRRRKSKS